MEVLVMHFPRSKNSTQYPILRTPKINVPPLDSETEAHAHTKPRLKLFKPWLCHFDLHISSLT
jgi:hypothetical protein